MTNSWKDIIHREVSKEQSKDTGMALVLILLLVTLATKRNGYLYGAMGIHVLNMIAPQVYKPAAVVWLTLAHVMGLVVSKVVLTIIFLAVLTPVGLIRKLIGADSLRLKAFKAGRGSAMQDRNHTYSAADIEQPY